MRFTQLLLNVDTMIAPPGGVAEAVASNSTTSGTMSPILMIVGYMIFLFVIMYFLQIKPAKKREEESQKLRDGIVVGDWVLLKTGSFGKVVDVTYENYIIEFGMTKTVNIPVLKTEVYAKREPNLSNQAPPEAETVDTKKEKK